MQERWTPAYAHPAPPRPAYAPLRSIVPWVVAAAFAFFLLAVVTNVLGYTNSGAALAVSLLSAPMTIAALVVVVLWSHRAGTNSDAFGANGRTLGTTWATVGWIIPLANWVLPYIAFRDIWKASDPDLPPDAWDAAKVPGWFTAWWLAWVGAGIVAQVVALIQAVRNIGDALAQPTPTTANPFAQPTYAPDLLPYTAVYLALYLIAYILFVRLVRELDKRQEAKAERLGLRPTTTLAHAAWTP